MKPRAREMVSFPVGLTMPEIKAYCIVLFCVEMTVDDALDGLGLPGMNSYNIYNNVISMLQ